MVGEARFGVVDLRTVGTWQLNLLLFCLERERFVRLNVRLNKMQPLLINFAKLVTNINFCRVPEGFSEYQLPPRQFAIYSGGE